MIVAVERADLLQHLGRGLGGVAPDLQQREDERGEFMAERDAREAHGDLRVARAADQEAGPAGVIVGAADADLVRQQRDLVEQARQLGRLCAVVRSEEHTSELQSLMRISYAVFCLKKKKKTNKHDNK